MVVVVDSTREEESCNEARRAFHRKIKWWFCEVRVNGENS